MRRTRESGSALLLAAVAFILMAGIGAAIFSLALAGRKTTLAASNSDAAYHVAEAGVDDAVNKMKAYYASPDLTDADFAVIGVAVKSADGTLVNEIKGEFQGGRYTVTIEPPYNGLGSYKVSAIGEANGEKRGIITWIAAEEEESSFKYGLFGDVSLDGGGNLITDGFMSANGSYASQAVNTHTDGKTKYASKTGHIGSNGDIGLGNGVLVFGNATPGPDGDLSGGGFVSGSKKPAPKLFPLDEVKYEPTAAVGALPGTTLTGPAEYHVSSLSMKSKSTLTIKGDVTIYVDGDIDIPSTAQVTVNGKLTIYQKSGTLTVHGGGQTSTKGGVTLPGAKAENFQIFSATTGAVKVNGHAGFFGTIYAPKSEVTLNGNADYFGSVVSKTIKAVGTAYFHYDESLAAVKTSSLKFNVKSVEQFVP